MTDTQLDSIEFHVGAMLNKMLPDHPTDERIALAMHEVARHLAKAAIERLYEALKRDGQDA